MGPDMTKNFAENNNEKKIIEKVQIGNYKFKAGGRPENPGVGK